jgi:cytosine/uracil/thiamine/allantoin permease
MALKVSAPDGVKVSKGCADVAAAAALPAAVAVTMMNVVGAAERLRHVVYIRWFTGMLLSLTSVFSITKQAPA